MARENTLATAARRPSPDHRNSERYQPPAAYRRVHCVKISILFRNFNPIYEQRNPMSDFSNLGRQALRQSQEGFQGTAQRKNQVFIGIPKETGFKENRLPRTPLAVVLLVENGHRVVMESGAGNAAQFLDHHYSEKGAEIAQDMKEVYQAHIINKISPPTLQEIEMMKNGQVLFSSQ